MLGNTVQSAIDAVNKWMYDLDHPLIGAAPTRPEDQWLVDKEGQFYESFLDKLLALSEESAKNIYERSGKIRKDQERSGF